LEAQPLLSNMTASQALAAANQVKAELARRLADATKEDADRIRAECRTLAGFVRHAWAILEPRAKLTWNWHMDAICDHLEAVTWGRINRLCINVPPGSSKSLLVSVLWPAWEWGPCGLRSMRYLNTAFNDGPVKRDTRKCRDLILSEWYKTLWPDVRLTRAGETSFANTDTGTREGVPFGSLTSQRGDRLIIDDPHSTETAESEAERNNTTRKFREGALDRLNDLEKSAIVVIMQRLHMDDVTGVIESLPELGFVHLIIPMRYEVAAAANRPPTLIGWSDPRTEEGELMDPVRFSAKEVNKLEVGKGDYAWAGQYQQRPAPREGGMFKIPEDWQLQLVVSPADVPVGGKLKRGWDIAGSKRKTSPYTVGTKMKRPPGGIIYVMDVKRKRDGIVENERMIVQTARDDGLGVQQSLPQDPASAGKSQKAHLAEKLGGLDFVFSTEEGDKQDRAIPFSSQWNAGMVRLVRGPWNHEYIEELRNFPTGSFKDQVDASSRTYMEILKEDDEGLGPPPETGGASAAGGGGGATDPEYDMGDMTPEGVEYEPEYD
jgi:predicted phage terminase large subunit-like protein